MKKCRFAHCLLEALCKCPYKAMLVACVYEVVLLNANLYLALWSHYSHSNSDENPMTKSDDVNP
jgi:hypothetical protein